MYRYVSISFFILSISLTTNQLECSGIHRSLGTHVSKIRSLTLDSTSYTPDIIELLKSVGNAKSNIIWDPRIDTAPKKTQRFRAARLKSSLYPGEIC